MEKYIYKIEVDAYKHYKPDIDYYTKHVYESRLLRRPADDPSAEWEVYQVFNYNSVEAVFISANHCRLKLEGLW